MDAVKYAKILENYSRWRKKGYRKLAVEIEKMTPKEPYKAGLELSDEKWTKEVK